MSWLLGAFFTGLIGLGTMVASGQRPERWLNWLSWLFYMAAYWLLVYAFFEYESFRLLPQQVASLDSYLAKRPFTPHPLAPDKPRIENKLSNDH